MPVRSSSPNTTNSACPTPTEVPRLAVNGVELNWDQWGHGNDPLLLLCHGYTGSSHDFALHVDHLSEQRRVVTLDQRGHGLSTKTGDQATYTVDQLVADLIGFIEEVADAPIDLLGHSMGGRVAIGVVLARPDLIRSLVLMCTSAWSFQSQDKDIREFMRTFITEFDPADGMPASMKLGLPEEVLIDASTPAEWRQRKDELSAGVDPYAFKALGLAFLSESTISVRPRLGEVACPVTVIAGSNDHPLVDQAPELAAEVADGQLFIVEGAYHSPQLTHPDEWRKAVEYHLSPLGV